MNPPQILLAAGELVPLPEGQGVYDIENVDRYLDVYKELLLKNDITEKLEGTNISISRKMEDCMSSACKLHY